LVSFERIAAVATTTRKLRAPPTFSVSRATSSAEAAFGSSGNPVNPFDPARSDVTPRLHGPDIVQSLFIASARGLGLTALDHPQPAQMRAATTAQTPGSLSAYDVTDGEAVPSISSVARTRPVYGRYVQSRLQRQAQFPTSPSAELLLNSEIYAEGCTSEADCRRLPSMVDDGGHDGLNLNFAPTSTCGLKDQPT
jgi:hypothetical protein